MKLRFITADGTGVERPSHTKKLMNLLASKGFENIELKETRSWPYEQHRLVEVNVGRKDVERLMSKLIADSYFTKYPNDGCI